MVTHLYKMIIPPYKSVDIYPVNCKSYSTYFKSEYQALPPPPIIYTRSCILRVIIFRFVSGIPNWLEKSFVLKVTWLPFKYMRKLVSFSTYYMSLDISREIYHVVYMFIPYPFIAIPLSIYLSIYSCLAEMKIWTHWKTTGLWNRRRCWREASSASKMKTPTTRTTGGTVRSID